ncbi:hypothetical protein C9J85_13355 [Haloferax sp. wsp5]|nr:hypothetical protein C9J85_13355 [Haloferax sp. wsp5]
MSRPSSVRLARDRHLSSRGRAPVGRHARGASPTHSPELDRTTDCRPRFASSPGQCIPRQTRVSRRTIRTAVS